MANIKSQKKRNRQNEKRRIKNSQVKSSLRTASKKIINAVEDESADPKVAQELLNNFIKRIDTSSRKKIVHWKTAARKKSRLAKKVNSLVQNKSAEA